MTSTTMTLAIIITTGTKTTTMATTAIMMMMERKGRMRNITKITSAKITFLFFLKLVLVGRQLHILRASPKIVLMKYSHERNTL